MNTQKFYDLFHKSSSPQIKIIDKKNFTYSTAIDIIEKSISGHSAIHILDYGCGTGAIDLYLASQQHQVLGTDVSSRALQIATQSAANLNLSSRAKFISLADFAKLKHEKFDLVICMEVLEHLPNDEQVLLELKQHLKRGGTLVISVPSVNAPLYKLKIANGFDKRVGHLRRYSPQKASELIRNNGLKVERIILTEGLLRNSLYIIGPLGKVIKFIRGPLAAVFKTADNLSTKLFGESDIFIIAHKN